MNLPANRPRILLAEDDPQLGPLVSRFLKANGFHVTAARDGREAWELAKQQSFDLIITDTHMPHLGGPELVALIRDRHPSMPVVHLTGSSEGMYGSKAYPGDVPNLHKPFELSTLLRMVTQVLAHQVEVRAPSAPPETADPRRALFVLVVNSDRGVTETVSKALRRRGDRAFAANSADEARKIMALAAPVIDHAIISLTMKPGSGLDLAREMHREYPALRILMTTGGAMPDEVEFPVLLEPLTLPALWAALA